MYKILLVDDEILVRDAIRENIDWSAMECELVGDCENGQQAAAFIQNHEVDIVLTDICMPYMDGMELSHFISDNYPDIVVVIFSGFNDFEYAKKAIQYNVSEYLLKPVTATELKNVIANMKEKVNQKRREKKRLESLTKKSEDYRKNAHMIRSKTLEALVKCTCDVQESLKELQSMGISLDSAGYKIAAFDIDLYSELNQVDMEKRQESALMAFVLFNVSNEIVSRERAGIVYQEGHNGVSVIFQGNSSKDFSEKVKQICKEIQTKFKEVIGLEVSIGIGKWIKSVHNLHESHDQAQEMLEHRYLFGGNLLLDVEEREEIKRISLLSSLEKLSGTIKMGRKDEMGMLIFKMKGEIKNAYVEKSMACVYIQQILRELVNCCENMAPDETALILKKERLMEEITKQNSFCEAMAIVKDYAEKVFEAIQNVNSSSGQRQAVLAMDYIQNNYMKPDLSLNGICSYLNISTSYFSTLFKEETGETFVEALTRVRMERAKEFLENTTLKNYEIAEKVGFADPHYFGIAFKKMTGKTPTEYARERRK